MNREERQKQDGKSDEPKGSEESEDKQDTEGGRKPEDKDKTENPRADSQNLPGWMARLPAEIRDYFAGGRYEKVPARYRFLIDRYTRWLNKKRMQPK